MSMRCNTPSWETNNRFLRGWLHWRRIRTIIVNTHFADLNLSTVYPSLLQGTHLQCWIAPSTSVMTPLEVLPYPEIAHIHIPAQAATVTLDPQPTPHSLYTPPRQSPPPYLKESDNFLGLEDENDGVDLALSTNHPPPHHSFHKDNFQDHATGKPNLGAGISPRPQNPFRGLSSQRIPPGSVGGASQCAQAPSKRKVAIIISHQ